MLNSTEESDLNKEDVVIATKEEAFEAPLLFLVAERVVDFIKLFSVQFYQCCFKSTQNIATTPKTNMSRRQRACEELGPVYLLRSVKDQVQLFQEKRGYTPEENNFVNLCAVIVQQAGHAMYAVFTMFLAMIPGATILLHVCHFILDRLLDIVTTRRQPDLVFKGVIFVLQLLAICIALHFVTTAIFSPIFSMQMQILSKLAFMDSSKSESSCN